MKEPGEIPRAAERTSRLCPQCSTGWPADANCGARDGAHLAADAPQAVPAWERLLLRGSTRGYEAGRSSPSAIPPRLVTVVEPAFVRGLEVGDEVGGYVPIDELKAKHRAAQTKVDEMKAASSEQWKAFKAGIDGAWNELGAACRKRTN